MKKNFYYLFIIIFLLVLTGCENKVIKDNDNQVLEKKYNYVIKLENDQKIYSTIDIKYNNTSLNLAFEEKIIDEDIFINSLTFVSDLNDGGSKLYKYSKEENNYGDVDFFVIKCNSYVGKKDIYIDMTSENLANECIKK